MVLLALTELAIFETLLVSMPESLGLLAFGVGLVVVAVLIRSFLSRGDGDKKDDEVTKNV